MLKISKKVEYSLMALKELDSVRMVHSNMCLKAKELGEKFNIPFDTTSKVLQIMKEAGILTAHKGAKGGYQLVKNLNEISYRELVLLIEGPSFTFDCNSQCNLKDTCNISTPLTRLNQQIEQLLSNLTVADLLSEYTLNFSKTMIATQKEHQL